MRNFLAFVGLAVVSIVGIGWYLDWYKVKTTPAADGHRTISVDVNTPKITQDIKKEEKNLQDLLHKNAPAPGTTSVPVTSPPGASPVSYSTPSGDLPVPPTTTETVPLIPPPQ